MTDEPSLRIYDEPHGDEVFIVDYRPSPPTWYRIDGTVFDCSSERPPLEPQELLRQADEAGVLARARRILGT